MADIAKLNALLRKRPIDSNSWPACFDIDRYVKAEPQTQLLIGPPAQRILIRGPMLAPKDWIRSADLPQYAERATEYHRGNNYWLPIPLEWFDARNWTDGYWMPR